MKVLIAIPAYNEASIIKDNILKIRNYILENIPQIDFLIVLADNNSTDETKEIMSKIITEYDDLAYLFVEQRGKGIAIKSAWQKYQSDYDCFVFMDADLATDLNSLPILINNLKQGNDLVIGSRYLKESQVKRSFLRKIFSAGYRLVVKIFLRSKIKDFPCGFKGINKKVLQEIVPLIKNLTWSFDTEMVYLVEKKGYKIKEIPVKWEEPRIGRDKSRVNIWRVSRLYLKEVLRLRSIK